MSLTYSNYTKLITNFINQLMFLLTSICLFGMSGGRDVLNGLKGQGSEGAAWMKDATG